MTAAANHNRTLLRARAPRILFGLSRHLTEWPTDRREIIFSRPAKRERERERERSPSAARERGASPFLKLSPRLRRSAAQLAPHAHPAPAYFPDVVLRPAAIPANRWRETRPPTQWRRRRHTDDSSMTARAGARSDAIAKTSCHILPERAPALLGEKSSFPSGNLITSRSKLQSLRESLAARAAAKRCKTGKSGGVSLSRSSDFSQSQTPPPPPSLNFWPSFESL